MTADLILKALVVITMNPTSERVDAVAIDTTSGRIAAVGSLEECQQARRTRWSRILATLC